MRTLINVQPMLTAIRRAAIALHIYVIDQEYKALGDYLTDVDASKTAAEAARKSLLMRRVEARAELNKLGGV